MTPAPLELDDGGRAPPRYSYEPSRELKALMAPARMKCAEGYRKMRRESPEMATAVWRHVRKTERAMIDAIWNGGCDGPKTGGLYDLIGDPEPDYSPARAGDLMGTTALTGSMAGASAAHKGPLDSGANTPRNHVLIKSRSCGKSEAMRQLRATLPGQWAQIKKIGEISKP